MRRSLAVKRVGHTGTLDPFASGLLVVLVGRATRLAQYLAGLAKEYIGTIKLGEVTDTCDVTGEVLERSDWSNVDDNEIHGTAKRLTGRYHQMPPVYSAKKVGGQRAYRLARRGEPVELEPREVEVFEFSIVEIDGPLVRFHCHVSSGTYVRALARDVGRELGCGAHLLDLRRESVGPFGVEEAVSIADVTRSTRVRPSLEAVPHLPVLQVDEELQRRLAHGQPVEAVCEAEGPVAIVAANGLVAVALASQGRLKPKVVLQG